MQERRREWLATLGASTLVLALFGGLYLAQPHLFWRDDFQIQHLPALRDLARALAGGEAPLLSPWTWSGGALLAEYQPGAASLFGSLLALVVWSCGPTPLHAAWILSAVHEAVLAAGAFRLARGRGNGNSAALMVAVVTALNGYLLVRAATDWYPALASFAWLPWYWAAAERIVAGDTTARRRVIAGAFLYLILAGGFPITALMALLVTAALSLRAHAGAGSWNRRALSGLAIAGALGTAFAAPAILPLAEWYRATLRFGHGVEAAIGWLVPPRAWLALALPSSAARWSTWDATAPPEIRAGIELVGGLVPLAALAAALVLGAAALRRRASTELLVLAAAVALAMLPGWGPFRWSFRWLPLVHLALALVGAQALEQSRVRRLGWVTPLAAAVLVAIAWAVDVGAHETGVHGTVLALVTLALLAGWAAFVAWRPHAMWIAPVIAMASLLATWATVPLDAGVPVLPLDDLARVTRLVRPGIRYLSVSLADDLLRRPYWNTPAGLQSDPDGTGATLLPGNLAQLVGARKVNGYSPFGQPGMRLLGFDDRGSLVDEQAESALLMQEMGPAGWPALAAVDGLLLHTSLARAVPTLEHDGWTVVNRDRDAIALERAAQPRIRALPWLRVVPQADFARAVHDRPLGSPPLVAAASSTGLASGLHRFAPARVRLIAEERNESRAWVAVQAGNEPALILFARCWYPGLRASLAGSALPVRRVMDLFPAVQVPAGAQGEVRLVYRPMSLELGLLIAGAAVLAAIVAMARERRQIGSLTTPLANASAR